MERVKGNSICCGGGGGGMWIEIGGGLGERLLELRLREATDTGADILVTTCPFCLLTFDEAAKSMEQENSIQVKDLIELVDERLLIR